MLLTTLVWGVSAFAFIFLRSTALLCRGPKGTREKAPPLSSRGSSRRPGVGQVREWESVLCGMGGEGWRPRRDGRDVGGEGLLGACRPSSEMGGETGWQYLRVGFASPWRVVRDGAVRLARHGLEDSCVMRGERCRPLRERRGAEGGGGVLLGAPRPSSRMKGGGDGGFL